MYPGVWSLHVPRGFLLGRSGVPTFAPVSLHLHVPRVFLLDRSGVQVFGPVGGRAMAHALKWVGVSLHVYKASLRLRSPAPGSPALPGSVCTGVSLVFLAPPLALRCVLTPSCAPAPAPALALSARGTSLSLGLTLCPGLVSWMFLFCSTQFRSRSLLLVLCAALVSRGSMVPSSWIVNKTTLR